MKRILKVRKDSLERQISCGWMRKEGWLLVTVLAPSSRLLIFYFLLKFKRQLIFKIKKTPPFGKALPSYFSSSHHDTKLKELAWIKKKEGSSSQQIPRKKLETNSWDQLMGKEPICLIKVQIFTISFRSLDILLSHTILKASNSQP